MSENQKPETREQTGKKKKRTVIAHSPFIWTPGSRCLRFFTRSVKQAGALPNDSAVPWRYKTGAWHIAPWTRAPFFEMWGKPKDCREPQEICHYYTVFPPDRQAFSACCSPEKEISSIFLSTNHYTLSTAAPQRSPDLLRTCPNL